MKPGLEQKVQQMLKSAKLYRTKCRAEILKVLTKANKPLSQDLIARKLGQKIKERCISNLATAAARFAVIPTLPARAAE